MPHYLTIQQASTPLTEPCVRISRTRLFSQSHSAATVDKDYVLFADAAKDNVPGSYSSVASCVTCSRCDPGTPLQTRRLTSATMPASGQSNPWPIAIRKISGLTTFTFVAADHPMSIWLRTNCHLMIRIPSFRPVG